MLSRIPLELTSLRQWVVWRTVVRVNADGEEMATKPPFNPHASQYPASVSDPGTWGSFAEAMECWRTHPDIEGVGFIFVENGEFFGIDIDDERKVRPEFLEKRRELVKDILGNVVTYTEVSPSGNGIHMIGRGRLPFGVQGRRSEKLQVEVYGSKRYFTMTGNVFASRDVITDQQGYLDEMFEGFTPIEHSEDLPDIDQSRRTDLTDEEVIRLATNFHPNFAPRFNGHAECEPGRWSETFMAIVGIVERFSGKVEQVERIILNSGMVRHSPPANDGESRAHKAQRNFRHVMARVRQGNSSLLYFADHGRQQWENMQRAKGERAKAAAEAIRKADEAIAGMSKGSSSILQAFAHLSREHILLTRPPGAVGRFVQATEDAMFNPFTKFAIPATLSVLSAIVSRGYKLPGGSGLNLNLVLVAPSATGKTQSMRAWQGFMTDALRNMERNLSSQNKPRIINTSTSSIQGIMKDFMAVPSSAWFVEECAALLSAMSNGVSTTDSALRDSFNQLYDCGQHGIWFSPPRSVSGQKAELAPIDNLNISTYWTTTPSKFDIFNDDALDGFLSRVIIIRHLTASGDIRRASEVKRHLPDDLAQLMTERMASAKKLDEAYSINMDEAAKLLTTVSTGQVDELFWEIMQIADRIKVASLNGDLPPAYTAVSRIPITAQRIAAVLAVFENPYAPAITEDQLKWAVGYLLQNLASTLNDMDTGEMGVTAANDTDVVVREMKRLLKGKHRDAPGIPKGELNDHLKRRAPFRDAISPADMVRKTIMDMIALNRVVEAPGVVAGRGRPPILICPTDDLIWSN